MRSANYHLGVGYEVWKSQDSWFWLVVSPYRNAGTIGAAPSRIQAASDACLAIEEMAAWLNPSVAASACLGISQSEPTDVMARARIQWEARLSQLHRYLSCIAGSRA